MSEIVGVSGTDPESLLTVQVLVRKGKAPKTVTVNMLDQLDIDKNNIQNDLLNQATNFGFIAVLAELAISKRDGLEQELEELKSVVYHEYKAGKYFTTYNTKPTEKALGHAVIMDDRVKQLNEELIEAKRQAGLLSACKQALDKRKDMLMAINANMRKELESTR